jgi:hypothetical protein
MNEPDNIRSLFFEREIGMESATENIPPETSGIVALAAKLYSGKGEMVG